MNASLILVIVCQITVQVKEAFAGELHVLGRKGNIEGILREY
jgi:hypothetical protein